MSDNLVLLEQNARFSKSLLWKYQQDYFAKKGIDAWAKGEVPYYVTSNVLIAYSFAEIAFRYIQDSLRNGAINPEFPVYLLELGTGSGKFSYLCLKTLLGFLRQYNMQNVKICYVMTDFTESNLSYWRQHRNFKNFLEQGVLDFGIYRIGEKQDITLVNRNITLTDNSSQNPIIAIGNYIFDTVMHDAFRVQAGKLEEGLLTTKTPLDNVVGDSVVSLDRLQADFSFHEISLPYYNNPDLDKILHDYLHGLGDGNFLVPTGAVACIDNLRRLCNNRLLLISSDKGYTSMESMRQLGNPHIAFHGSFSMMVNFDFVARYLANLGGDQLLTEDHEGMKTLVFSLGQKFTDLPETSWAYDHFSLHLSTKEFLEIKNVMIKDPTKLDLDDILSLMKFSYWDSDIFMAIVGQLINLINQASPGYVRSWRRGLHMIADNYYFIKNYKNVLFELGHVYHLIGDLDEAMSYYQQSIDLFGEESPVFFNLGLCAYYKKNYTQALFHFEKAVALNPENKAAKEWITHVTKELTSKSIQ